MVWKKSRNKDTNWLRKDNHATKNAQRTLPFIVFFPALGWSWRYTSDTSTLKYITIYATFTGFLITYVGLMLTLIDKLRESDNAIVDVFQLLGYIILLLYAGAAGVTVGSIFRHIQWGQTDAILRDFLPALVVGCISSVCTWQFSRMFDPSYWAGLLKSYRNKYLKKLDSKRIILDSTLDNIKQAYVNKNKDDKPGLKLFKWCKRRIIKENGKPKLRFIFIILLIQLIPIAVMYISEGKNSPITATTIEIVIVSDIFFVFTYIFFVYVFDFTDKFDSVMYKILFGSIVLPIIAMWIIELFSVTSDPWYIYIVIFSFVLFSGSKYISALNSKNQCERAIELANMQRFYDFLHEANISDHQINDYIDNITDSNAIIKESEANSTERNVVTLIDSNTRTYFSESVLLISNKNDANDRQKSITIKQSVGDKDKYKYCYDFETTQYYFDYLASIYQLPQLNMSIEGQKRVTGSVRGVYDACLGLWL